MRRLAAVGAGVMVMAAAAAGAAAGPTTAPSWYAKPQAVPAGPFAPTWDSLREHYRIPAWFGEAKFGIFIHWGLYAIPAHHNEWYAQHMYSNAQIAKWHAEHVGPQDKFGYKDFVPLFKAERYDPAAWADLFAKAGARYVMPVAEHHDGFAMYDSDLTRWCAGKMGPKRDLIGELAKAVRARGMRFGVSSHRIEHHTFMYPKLKGLKTDLFDPAYADFYGPPVPGSMNDGNASPEFQGDWLARCQELVDKYEPDLVYFDNGINAREYDDIKLRFAAYYYNRAAERWHKEVSVVTKERAYLTGSIRDYEKSVRMPKEVQPAPWQVDEPIAGNSWGYVTDMRYRSAGAIIAELCDVVSKNGNLLLNISPMADGTIPEEQRAILLTIGNWLGTNGEAIYGSRPWTPFSDGQDVRFTVRGDAVYAIMLRGAAAGAVTIAPLSTAAGDATSVEVLGSDGPVKYSQSEAGLRVELPATTDGLPRVIRVTGLNVKG